jgi:hypothetical protein
MGTKKNANRFMFMGTFSHFKIKNNNFGEDLYGFLLKDIKKISGKKILSNSQWFNLSQSFKEAFVKYKDDELPGKTIKFEAALESSKKGYYTYQDNLLISSPEDLEYRLLRATKVTVLG